MCVLIPFSYFGLHAHERLGSCCLNPGLQIHLSTLILCASGQGEYANKHGENGQRLSSSTSAGRLELLQHMLFARAIVVQPTWEHGNQPADRLWRHERLGSTADLRV